jgi:alpha-tubulin suppressor-like RCC1 family protein
VATAPGIGVFCWGDGSMGQLGGGTSAAPSFATAVTLPVSLATPVDSNTLAAGGSRSCVVSNANEVLCWGVLVNGASPIAPTRLVAADSMTPVHAIAVAAGGSHTCGLHRIDATHIEAWCMGSNDFGQLGRGATGMPAMQTSPILGPTDLLALAAGSDFACAARRYGGVVCWGNNASFQGGDSSGGALLTPDPVASLP